MAEGLCFDTKRFALHDGPGIRTTIFLKGCPLRCAWCHNPESQAFGITEFKERGTSVGRLESVDSLMAALLRDTPFFDESGGGVTFSGGEPLAHPEFLMALLDRCGELDIHRAVDTCGYAPRAVLLDVAKRTDLFLYDLKLAHDAEHVEYTGVDARQIQENLTALCATDVPIEVRIPVIPGISGTSENIMALGAFLIALPRRLPVRLLPYHRAAMDKYARFDMPPPLPDTPEPTQAHMHHLAAVLRSLELEIRS